MSTVIVWLRRDLRVHDNPALARARERYEHIIPVYIHAPAEDAPWSIGAAGRWWLHHSLAALDESLRRYGSRLLLRSGSSLDQLRELIRQSEARAVYWNRFYEPAVVARDTKIKAALREDGIHVESFEAALLREPWTVKTGSGQPYKVFAPFWKACIETPPQVPLAAPDKLPPITASLRSEKLADFELMPKIPWYETISHTWQPGESAALQRLQHFCDAILRKYPQRRNLPALDGVSRLSPSLHFGELSPRQVWQAVVDSVGRERADSPLEYKSSEAFLRELGWREFAHHVLFHWPHTSDEPMDERFRYYPWREDYQDLLAAWQKGRTGIPLVDAGMRELWQTGWMHNRVRMVVASFLTKNCRIPWQQGTRWFWDTLVDADLANNSLGWQWTAGCGTDAAPYFRIFNPVRQGEQYDPDGDYVRYWLPELQGVAKKYIHKPWEMPAAEWKSAGLRLGEDYPLPIIDPAESRKQALAGYQQVKNRVQANDL